MFTARTGRQEELTKTCELTFPVADIVVLCWGEEGRQLSILYIKCPQYKVLTQCKVLKLQCKCEYLSFSLQIFYKNFMFEENFVL